MFQFPQVMEFVLSQEVHVSRLPQQKNVTGRACAQMELGDMSGKEKERGSCCFFDLLVELTHPQSKAGGRGRKLLSLRLQLQTALEQRHRKAVWADQPVLCLLLNGQNTQKECVVEEREPRGPAALQDSQMLLL